MPPKCLWADGPDRRKAFTKSQIDAMIFKIQALEVENARLTSLVPPTTYDSHALFSDGGQDLFVGAAGRSLHLLPAPSSPASFQSSISLSTDGSGLLTVPNLSVFSRGASPVPSYALPGDSTDAESVLVDEFSRLWVSTGKHFVTHAADEDPIAVAGSSPIALAYTSPRPPSPLVLDPQTLNPSFMQTSNGISPDFKSLSNDSTGILPAAIDCPAFPVIHKHDEFCPCDWARHIPEHVRRDLTRADHDSALEQYFKNTAWHLQVIPDAFLRDMSSALASFPPETHTLHFSPALHCAILVEAGAFAQSSSLLAREDIRESLARAARDLAEEECSKNVNIIPAIRALCIVARYHLGFSTGAPRAFGAFGTALRVALRSGLALKPVSTSSPEERRTRAWCMAVLMNQDVSMSLHLGQEISVPLDLVPVISTQTTETFKDDPELMGLAHTTTLVAIAARIAAVYSRDRPGSDHEFMALQMELATWEANRPSSIVLSRGNAEHASASILMLDMAYNRVLILLHRRFCAGAHALEESQKIVHNASKRIFQTLATFERLHTFGGAPFALIQMVYVAGAAQLMRTETLSQNAVKARAEVNGFVSQARDALQLIARIWPCAAYVSRVPLSDSYTES
ncbi:hypothetical protein AURDEDRAFT_166234 [Auricularia subglabra TFB-10046 SS5]|nr:hypothetical protein AURDEDRAFT_166234 [Auricularia subglabra TFB-10046 SS5]